MQSARQVARSASIFAATLVRVLQVADLNLGWIEGATDAEDFGLRLRTGFDVR